MGLQELNHHRYGLALSILLGLKTVEPDHAFDMYSALAYCYLQLKSPMQARDLELRARRYAKTLEEQQRVESFLEFLDETQAAASLGTAAIRNN